MLFSQNALGTTAQPNFFHHSFLTFHTFHHFFLAFSLFLFKIYNYNCTIPIYTYKNKKIYALILQITCTNYLFQLHISILQLHKLSSTAR